MRYGMKYKRNNLLNEVRYYISCIIRAWPSLCSTFLSVLEFGVRFKFYNICVTIVFIESA